MKYFILLFLAIQLLTPAIGITSDCTTCQALRTGFEFHMKQAETPGIDVDKSIAESLKAINYLLLYQIHRCESIRLFTLLYPSSKYTYRRPKISIPTLEIHSHPALRNVYEIRQNPYDK